MKNERLDELTELVAATRHGLPELLLRGDGRFVDGRGKHVPHADVLEDIHVARRRLAQIHDALLNEPRRRSPGKAGA